MENITLTPEQVKTFRKFSDNFESYNRMYNDIKSHVGEYVSISEGKILEYAKTREKLVNKYKDVPGVFIEMITDSNLYWIL